MAIPRNIRLTIENSNSRRIDVTVCHTIEFNQDELYEDFIERIELWGDDKMFNGKDNRLLIMNNATINPQGETSMRRDITRSVVRAMLDEDKHAKDEVYAKVVLEPRFGNARAESPVFQVKIRKKD